MLTRLFALLRGNKALQAVTSPAFIVFLILGFVLLLSLERRADEIVVMAETSHPTIDLGKITCLSIDSHKVTFKGKDVFYPALAKFTAETLMIKPVLVDAAHSECTWVFSANIAPVRVNVVDDGIDYDVGAARYVVSIGICERIDATDLNPDKCLSKEIYVFNSPVETKQLLKVGIIGLKLETGEKKVFGIKVRND